MRVFQLYLIINDELDSMLISKLIISCFINEQLSICIIINYDNNIKMPLSMVLVIISKL